MKKQLFIISTIFCASGLFAQNSGLNLNYIENLYHATDNGTLNGSARYRALSGAMGALGGDLSATNKNPAGAAVFLGSEFSITAGTNSTELDGSFNGYSVGKKSNNFKMPQVGGVIVFDDLASNNFTNFSISINYQEKENDEFFNYTTDLKSSNLNGFVNDLSTKKSKTNISIAASYRDQVYFGLGFNAKRFESIRYNQLSLHDDVINEDFVYNQNYSPNNIEGDGFSISAGIIGRVTPELRLGLAYESPTWYVDINDDSFRYNVEEFMDGNQNYYGVIATPNYFINDLTSGQKITGSAAYVFGKSGLISGDVTFTDYSIAKYSPENSFNEENAFIDDYLKSSTTFNLGAEYRIQDFTLRGGYRYVTSPFDKVNLNLADNSTYQAYGDLNGFSAGLGYTFNNFYIDASYNFSSQDRDILLSGNYYDPEGLITVDNVSNIDEAKSILIVNTDLDGYSTSLHDIEKKWSDFVVTVGLRF